MKGSALKRGVILVLSAFTLFAGCRKDPNIVDGREDTGLESFEFKVPANWPEPTYKFQGNTLTKAGFELGRKLFFEPRLSRNNTTSCASCHLPTAAFSQPDHAVSHGVENRLGTRNSPGLFNLNWHPSFFWDGGVNHIESQPLAPIQNPVEMDEKIENVVMKLNGDAAYKALFKNAFGDETINSQRIFKAMAQFMGMMVSADSKYDKYVRGEAGGNMNVSELEGLQVFRAKCATCHKEPLFSDFSFRNNGLPNTSVNDSGRAMITKADADMYKFKVPSLRNLRYTYPYMHDGRFNTLQQVLDYYTSASHNSALIDPAIGTTGLALTADDKTNLISFLNTLNDETFVKDKRFQEVK